MRKRALLILNGKVAGNDALRAAVVGQREAGHRIQIRVTWEKGDAQRFVSEAGNVDLLIAGGGDGTLNGVVHRFIDPPLRVATVLGMVALGNGKDFRTGWDIPRDPEKA